MKNLRPGTLQNTGLIILLVISGSMNAVLAHQIKAQRQIVERIRAEGRLQAGTLVPAITGKTPQGEQTTIDFAAPGHPTVLYVFSPTCGWCKRNLENMMTLRREIGSHYAFVGVSLTSTGLTEYVSQNKLDYPVVADIPDSVKAAYKMGGTPSTIVVSPDNKVLKVWSGAYQGTSLQEIENYFQVKLPGLTPQEKLQAGQ